MNSFDADLTQRLATIRAQGLYRELRRVDSPQTPHLEIAGKSFLNFSSNDYLGLANEPSLKQAAIEAIEKFGSGSGASRLICGSLAPHHELEMALAQWKGTEAALSFSSGYATALGTISALLDKNDIIILDKLVHASIVDAARLSAAKLRVFAHNDLQDLENILQWAEKQRAEIITPASENKIPPRILIITESVFSMDGDMAPLPELVVLKEKYHAWLMVDEAHATGLYGAKRCGLAQAMGVNDQIEIQMGTLGKALGSSGGYICGSRLLIEFLINRARSFIFSTAPVPTAAAAAMAAVKFVQSDEGQHRVETLSQRIRQFHTALKIPDTIFPQAIIPLVLGDEQKAVAAASELRDQGIFVPAIRYPTVARHQARLRITLTAAHTEADVHQLITELNRLNLNFST